MENEIRVGGWGPDRTRFAEHQRPPAPVVLKPPLGTFIDGSAADLTPEAIQRIYAINQRVGTRLPEISADSEHAVLFYAVRGFDSGQDSLSLTVNSGDGIVIDGGYGEEWWQSDPGHPTVKAFIDEFGPHAAFDADPESAATRFGERRVTAP